MIISRGLSLIKCTSMLAKHKFQPKLIPIRNSSNGVWYRDMGEVSITEKVITHLLGGFMWWWILWHCWHDWGHIVGEFDYPDASKWTDEELGIPPDDYD